MELYQLSPVALLLGLISHTLLFIRDEWHLRATYLLRTCSCASFCLSLFLYLLVDESMAGAAIGLLLIFGSYFGSLFGSIVIYRVFFHNLHGFPGPPLAPISKLWHVAQCLDSKNHLLMATLHQMYGDFVRTGRT